MKNSKIYLGAVAVAAVVGFATPAAATWTGPVDITVGPVDCAAGTGEVCNPAIHVNILGTVFGATHQVGYAGPLTVSIGPPVSENGVIVFCDDLAKGISSATFHNYFVSDPATPLDVVNYLNVGLSTAHEIMGLTALGTYDYIHGLLTPELGAAFQMAIWELEYGGTGTLTGQVGFQALVASLIGDAAADYAFFTDPSIWLVPWSFSQLESPCDADNVGLVTKDPPQGPGTREFPNPNCQNHQGLIAAIPGVKRENVPEPITLSLFGAGLAGVAAYRRRRKNIA